MCVPTACAATALVHAARKGDEVHLSAADANILINTCRLAAQRYTFAYQEPIPVEQLVRTLCDNKQVSVLLLSAKQEPALLDELMPSMLHQPTVCISLHVCSLLH